MGALGPPITPKKINLGGGGGLSPGFKIMILETSENERIRLLY